MDGLRSRPYFLVGSLADVTVLANVLEKEVAQIRLYRACISDFTTYTYSKRTVLLHKPDSITLGFAYFPISPNDVANLEAICHNRMDMVDVTFTVEGPRIERYSGKAAVYTGTEKDLERECKELEKTREDRIIALLREGVRKRVEKWAGGVSQGRPWYEDRDEWGQPNDAE